ncbi:AGD2-like defense response protein 1 isoform 1 [Hibiscus syriacus]|uniref:AGD2-like defense response protein 1 isoform 1 n=1 Tax=Hibiscus syriacus TaxID=106335 RepID=A0A6A3C198_HIBSY|nr:AGD2-like defense response protein 1 isoform 1 [Hibiscus syriacus]
MPNFALEDESRKGLASLRMWNVVGSGIKIADVIRGWLGRKNALNRMPFCGCAIGAIDGCLYVLGGFSRASALRCVWQYNPVLNSWSEVSSMLTGRAYCKTAILNNRLYAVGGVTRGHVGLTPLQSAEVFDPCTGVWSQNSKHAIFKSSGEVYDPEVNSWVEMPAGMSDGWPAKQAGTKLSITVDGELYALDLSNSPESVRIKVYDFQDDAWKVVVGEVPIPNFTDSGSPYLLAGLLGKIHVITKDANSISILQADVQNHVSSPSASSSDSYAGAHPKSAGPATAMETVLWRVIAERTAGSSELVSCQTLNI